MTWKPITAACSLCATVRAGLQHRDTGAVMCFVCHGSALSLIDRALRSKAKRDAALN